MANGQVFVQTCRPTMPPHYTSYGERLYENHYHVKAHFSRY